MKAGAEPSRGPAARVFRGRYSLLAVFVLALTVRLLFVMLRDTAGLSEPPNPDSVAYRGLARNLLAGTAYGSGSDAGCVAGTFFAPPLYPYFLAGIYALPGPFVQLALAAQAILGALTAVFIAGMAGRLFGFKALLVAGFLAATQPYLVMRTAEFMTETLFVFLYSGSLLLCVMALTQTGDYACRRHRRDGSWEVAAAGILMGAAMLCRPTPLVGLPVLTLTLALVERRRPLGARLFQAALFALAAILVIGPWVLRIHSRCRAWVPIASAGEFTLYIGNAPGWADRILLGEELDEGIDSIDAYFPLLGQHAPGWFARGALAAIGKDPHRFARLSLARAKLLFKVLPERRGPPLRYLLALWHYTILFPLGVAGLAYWLRRRQSFAWLMLPFLLTMCLVHVFSLPNMRYRVVLVDAVLLVFLAGLLAGPVAGAASRLGAALSRSLGPVGR